MTYLKKRKQTNNRITLLLTVVILCIFCTTARAAVVDKVIAVVNDELITQSELDRLLVPVYQRFRTIYEGDELVLKIDEARRLIFNQLIKDKIILSEARKRGIAVNPEAVEQKIDELREKFSSKDEFEQAMIRDGVAMAQLQERYGEELMKENFVQQEVRGKVIVTPAEMHEYYQANKDSFVLEEQVRLFGILIKIADESHREDGYNRMVEIRKRLEQGENFSELATLYSESANARQGGDMGFVKRGQLMKELDDIAFSLEEGQVSDIIETSVGYHVFKIAKKKEEQLIAFEDVSQEIQRFLFNQKAKARFEELVDELRQNAYISIK
jgi:parvulin-like peptidyl-prolyl isomerase